MNHCVLIIKIQTHSRRRIYNVLRIFSFYIASLDNLTAFVNLISIRIFKKTSIVLK